MSLHPGVTKQDDLGIVSGGHCPHHLDGRLYRTPGLVDGERPGIHTDAEGIFHTPYSDQSLYTPG